eukprot:Phypoly_transcript_18232.p1 GENE.Phypoly_transcript_18232~~Phypoly_transcript_18232.p1  ORF type:complete len:141 (+),score=10.97 Phypoly_transcript_18232:268-690(+)
MVIKLIAWFFPLIVQIILMIPVFKVVYTVTKDVRHSVPGKKSHRGILWLCARFIGAQCNQVVIWVPATVWQLYTLFDKIPPYALTVIIAISFGFPALNGFIVLAGNTPLKKSIFGYFARLHSWCDSKLLYKSQKKSHKFQ